MTGDGIEAAEQIGKPLFEDNAVGYVQLNRFIFQGLGGESPRPIWISRERR
jgi:hypothetical protein